MARFISNAKNTLLLHRHRSSPTLSLLRHRSSQPTLIEVDLSSASSSSSSEYESTMKMFDDLIHRILVKKATPDWLPFVPGSSFWVPPRPSPSNVVDLVHKLTDEPAGDSISLATFQGWPSSKFFLKENESAHDEDTGVDVSIPEGMEGTVTIKVLTLSDNVAHSEDEEG